MVEGPKDVIFLIGIVSLIVALPILSILASIFAVAFVLLYLWKDYNEYKKTRNDGFH